MCEKHAKENKIILNLIFNVKNTPKSVKTEKKIIFDTDPTT